jgi:CubicO group peptidase (beta-lactamase class C family)
MGDREPAAPLPPALDGSPLDSGKLEAASTAAFADPADHTAAFVAVYRGRIVAERYGPAVDRHTQLESWSMGKSLTATLIGLLIEEGALGWWDAAPVPEWHDVPGDPRAAIRVADLLRMSSGLFFTHSSDPPERLAQSYLPGQPDHSLGYVAPVDVFQLSTSRPLEHPPATVGRYRNCDPLVLGYLVKRIVEARGESYLRWPQRALFDRIGIRRQVLETDVYGNFILTGFDFGTARGWARLGLLWLQDGVWQGERLLPEGFAEFARTSAPGWPADVYGGLFWLDHAALPQGSFSMRGAAGQEVAIVPSHHLVLVRMGHSAGWPLTGSALAQEERRDRAFTLVLEAVDPSRKGTSSDG